MLQSAGTISWNETDTSSGGSTVSLLLGQSANHTLTVNQWESHYISQTLRSTGVNTTATSSNNWGTSSTGTFSLAAGNPYLPPYQGAAQGGGQGVGLLLPWSYGGGGGDLVGNRVSPSFRLIDPGRVFPRRTGNPTDGGLGLGGNDQQSSEGGGPGNYGGGNYGGGQNGRGSSRGSQSSGGGYSLSGVNGAQNQSGQVGQLHP